MNQTPLLKKLNNTGTTFYTFSSAANDLSKCMGNTQKEFIFSHFVCLNIPDFIIGNETEENTIKLDTFKCSNVNVYDNKDLSTLLTESLQNYVFNFEEVLLSNNELIVTNSDKTVAERVFWHWLNKMNGTQFEYNTELKKYIEKNNIVKYIGNIDITNNVDLDNNAYTEVYVHIPSEEGSTPNILFDKSFDDKFYKSNFTINNIHNGECFILGQTEDGQTDNSPLSINNTIYGLTKYALYDESNTTDFSYVVDDNDGYVIDFNINSYNIENQSISTINELNKNGDSFEFNAVLIYYDVLDTSSNERNSNLYGILFLDKLNNVNNNSNKGYLQRYPKYKPIDNVQNGNSYGFKLNFRIDIEPNKNGISTLVNEYNTFSMSLFTDALTKMQECSDLFINLQNNYTNFENRLKNLEYIYSFIDDYKSLLFKIDDLYSMIENSNLALSSRNSLLDIISNISDKVESIINGKANIELQYNTDVIKGGYNISIDNNTPNKITINSNTFGYSIVTPIIKSNNIIIDKYNPISLNDNFRDNNEIYFKLKPMSNMVRIYVDDNVPANYDIVIYIDDNLNKWQNGQNVKLVFPNLSTLLLNNKNIIIKYGENFSMEKIILSNEISNNFPIIELIYIINNLEYDILK